MAIELSPVSTEGILRNVVAEDLSFVVTTYLSDTPLQLRTMREALENGDVQLIGRAARSLRSSSERVGATSMAQLARKLHTVVGYRGSVKDVIPLLTHLEDTFGNLAPHLLALLQEKVTASELAPALSAG